MRSTYDEGAVGLGLLIRRLQTTASVLHVGAHPDDEDSGLIARLARADGARVAYLSLNRGEGGQNRIGPELFDALGVIRTEELLQARRLDGGGQFFTRTFDFGFSKTRAEAAARWGEREVLADMVRVIRLFRPLVVVSRWKGTAEDGHGQHQLAGHLTPQAVRAAADPAEFPEQLAEGLRPWQARKLYFSDSARPAPAAAAGGATSSGGGAATADTAAVMRVETGAHDPLTGRSSYELAIEGRSQHKSQEQGGLELRGPQTSGVRLVERAPGLTPSGAREQNIFDGVDTSVRGIARAANLSGDALDEYLRAVERDAALAAEKFNALDPRTVVAALRAGLLHTREARAALKRAHGDGDARAEADLMLARKEGEFAEALRLALGARVDALADAETVVPGESFAVVVRAYASGEGGARATRMTLRARPGWGVEAAAAPEGGGPPGRREQASAAQHFRVTAPADAEPTQPYWFDDERRGDLYEWDADDPKSRPFAPPLLTAEVTFETGGAEITVEQPVEHRRADAVRGELRRELNVVPEIDVQLEPKLVVVPLRRAAARGAAVEFTVRLTNNVARTTEGAGEPVVSGGAGLSAAGGWRQTPASHPYRFAEKGERALLRTRLHLPPGVKAGEYKLAAGAGATFNAAARRAAPRRFEQGEQLIAYPHIQTRQRFVRQEARVLVFDLEVAPVRVGYVMGSGDEVPAAIERMGLGVTQLSEADLSAGDLSRFDTIVVGVRASQTRPDFAANHRRLLEFVERGGALVVQYQRPDYAERNLAPFPATMQARDERGAQTVSRVVDENAPVRIVERAHAAFNFPNRITEADFGGWVQERNLYNFVQLDARYTPLLESHDAGEPPNSGGLVYARVGRGHYVYTSYSFFRQLPAGVPGAYRLFANLLSLPRAAARTPAPRWRFRRLD